MHYTALPLPPGVAVDDVAEARHLSAALVLALRRLNGPVDAAVKAAA